MTKLKFTKTDSSGNTTAFVWTKVSRKIQPKIARRLMKLEYLGVEQVGFIEKPINPKALARLQMMGGEISINATLSLAFVLANETKKKKFYLELSGYPRLIKCQMAKDWPKITFKPIAKIKKVELKINKSVRAIKLVNLGGIAYFLISENFYSKTPNYQKEFKKIKKQVEKMPLPQAWGAVFYKKNKIQPVVYVAKTNSIVCENACGSGSLAFSLVKNYQDVLQPSGKLIEVQKAKNESSVSGKAKITAKGFVYT